jgi:hypothetical protein
MLKIKGLEVLMGMGIGHWVLDDLRSASLLKQL